MTETTDIGTLASLARTALTDPAGLPDPHASAHSLRIAERKAVDSAEYPRASFVVGCLDRIIAITDPADDEREFENCADGLAALGGAVERIREQFEDAATSGTVASDARSAVLFANARIPEALDKLDEAVAALREAHEAQVDAALYCEDCAVNGEDCLTHGEAWRLARRAVRENPERVLALLREDVSL